MQYRDYYKILGVERTADEAQIKRAYRVLARKYHPDVSTDPDAEKRFKEVGEAYAVLKDPEKRAAYDQLGEQWKAGQEFRPPPDWGTHFEFSGAGDAGSFDHSAFFESLFGHGPQSPFAGTGQAHGAPQSDHHAKILIDLEDSFFGTERNISLRLPESDASGHLRVRDRTIKVRIPRGIRQGQHIRLKGLAGSGPSAGDLYLEVEFRPHARFRVVDSDLYVDLPVTPWEAALGARVRLPTPDGHVELTVPANTSAGRKLRLKGKGMPGKQPGDLYAVVAIQTPPAQTDDDKRIYREMEKHFKFNPRA